MLFRESIECQEIESNIKIKDTISEVSFIGNTSPTGRDIISEFSFLLDTSPTTKDIISEFSFI